MTHRRQVMTEDEMRSEIDRLQGELSAATACIGDIFQIIINLGGDDMHGVVLGKINSRRIEIGALDIKGPDWRAGIQRFNDRLAKVLTRDES